jgi:hypothetical protein
MIKVDGQWEVARNPDRRRFFESWPYPPSRNGEQQPSDPEIYQISYMVRSIVADFPYDMVTVLMRSPGQTSEELARILLPDCTAAPRDVPGRANRAFVLAAADGSRVCGRSDEVWEERPEFVLRHYDDGCPPGIDPLSYTLYVRDDTGRWTR